MKLGIGRYDGRGALGPVGSMAWRLLCSMVCTFCVLGKVWDSWDWNFATCMGMGVIRCTKRQRCMSGSVLGWGAWWWRQCADRQGQGVLAAEAAQVDFEQPEGQGDGQGHMRVSSTVAGSVQRLNHESCAAFVCLCPCLSACGWVGVNVWCTCLCVCAWVFRCHT